jgi:AraC-like DNA-binding protein
VRYRNDASVGAQIRTRLRQLAPHDWPDLDSLARSLCLSATTLQRRLQGEGLSYQRLRDALRRDMAIDWLEQGEHSVAEVAARLGFAEPAAFQRAFKKWTGITPGAYRRGSPEATPVQMPHPD